MKIYQIVIYDWFLFIYLFIFKVCLIFDNFVVKGNFHNPTEM